MSDNTKPLNDILKLISAGARTGGYTDEEIEEMERKEREAAAYERYKKNVPQRYWHESLETFRADTADRARELGAVREFCQEVNAGRFRSLMMIGAAGTGKTHLACAMIRECGGLYRIAPNIVEEIRRAKSFTAKDTEAEILKFYANAKLLIIDEIGRGINETDEKYMIYQILNERYNRSKSTVLISNHTKKDFISYIGIAAADRLTESGETVEFAGASYRQQLRKSVFDGK